MGYKITSAAQLADLPDKSIVIGSDGIAYQKLDGIYSTLGLAWYSTCATAATPKGLLEHHAPLTLVYTPHYQREDGTAISDPDYLRTQRTIAAAICDSPHPLMLTEIHDLAYQIADALVKYCIIPAPRPRDDAGNERSYNERIGIRHKATVAAQEFMYAALGPDYDTDMLAKDLIYELEAEGFLAASKDE